MSTRRKWLLLEQQVLASVEAKESVLQALEGQEGVIEMAKKFSITTIQSGYGKGTYRIIDNTGRIYPSGGLLKTPTRAKNYLAKIMNRYS